jgi:hypothetical protein
MLLIQTWIVSYTNWQVSLETTSILRPIDALPLMQFLGTRAAPPGSVFPP